MKLSNAFLGCPAAPLLEDVLLEFAGVFGREGDLGGVEFQAGRRVAWPEALPSNGAVAAFYGELTFSTLIVNGVFFCQLHALEKLPRAQEGWRLVAGPDGQLTPNPNWPPSWLVIGDRNGDAIIADVSQEDGPIYGCIHGGPLAECLTPMAPSLAAWLQALARSMRCEEDEFGLDSVDETCAPKAELFARAEEIAREVLGDQAVEGWLRFFFE